MPVITDYEHGWGILNFHPVTKAKFALISPNATCTEGNNQCAVQSDDSLNTSAGTATFTGLPVIGFAVQTFRPTAVSSYAGTFYHRFTSGWNHQLWINPF